MRTAHMAASRSQGATRSKEETDAKVKAYQAFLDGRLRVDLARLENRRDEVRQELQDYVDLERNIGALREGGERGLSTLVDLGTDAQVYCQAEVPDASRVYVSIGLGFHLECTLEEASVPIGLQKKALQAKVDGLTGQMAAVKADMKLVTEGIRELMQLPSGGSSASRTQW
mmetsp:Transcript_34239/g.61129  ORF Transcript_34239/g.61129 Transcript_34239/m.61129 type:complete len:171 (-) Transcript_34239:266-778(-)